MIFQSFQSAIVEAGRDRKAEARQSLSRSEEDLLATGKWLERKQQLLLASKLEDYFSAEQKGVPSAADAYNFQSHLIVYMLNGTIPVPRSQLLVNLRLGESFKLNAKGDAYEITVSLYIQLLHITRVVL
jgi:hypothetical protein